MKIILNLKKSINNYDWESKEKLENWLEDEILRTLWRLYDENDDLSVEQSNRLYDILDMFSSYEIIGNGEKYDK